jgi:apolipoprotein N-acyltransferase
MVPRAAWPLLAVVASGGLYALLLPPFEQSLLAWIALAPLLAVLANASPLRGFGFGLLWALVATIGVAWWFPGMLERYFELSPALAWLGLLGLGVLVDGLPYAVFGAFVGWGARRGILGPITVASAWACAEWVRANGIIANPFAQLAYSQSGTAIAQVADVGGPYPVGMLIVAANVAIAGLWIPSLGGQRPLRRAGGVAAAVAVVFAYGSWRLQDDFGTGEALQVAVVQGAVRRELEWDRSTRDANLETYLQLTQRSAVYEPDIVFWPEFAIDFYLSEPTARRTRLQEGVRSIGADLVLGGSHYRLKPAHDGIPPSTDYLNSVFVIDAQGRVSSKRYDKRRLVPFAEYGPLGDTLRAATAVYVPGTKPNLLESHGLRIGAFICGEALYPEIARELVVAGAQILTNPSNDYWFGHPQAAAHQLQVATFRAIENRRYLVRPTSTGISAIIDPRGRALTHSEGEGPEVLHARLRPSSAMTPYHTLGEIPMLAAGSIVGVALGFGRRKPNSKGE